MWGSDEYRSQSIEYPEQQTRLNINYSRVDMDGNPEKANMKGVRLRTFKMKINPG